MQCADDRCYFFLAVGKRYNSRYLAEFCQGNANRAMIEFGGDGLALEVVEAAKNFTNRTSLFEFV